MFVAFDSRVCVADHDAVLLGDQYQRIRVVHLFAQERSIVRRSAFHANEAARIKVFVLLDQESSQLPQRGNVGCRGGTDQRFWLPMSRAHLLISTRSVSSYSRFRAHQ